MNKEAGTPNEANSSLRAIDASLLAARAETSNTESPDLGWIANDLAAGILTYHSVPQQGWPSHAIDGIFSPELSYAQNRFTAACLLRLLAYNPDVFRDANLRIRAFKLFDSVLGEDLYKRLKIEARQQTHEKEQKLKDIAAEVERELDKAVAPGVDLASFASFKAALTKLIRRVDAQVVLLPFLPRVDFHTALSAMADTVTAYRTAAAERLVQSYNAAEHSITYVLDQAENLPTEYSTKVLLTPLRCVLSALRADFSNSPVRQAPNITVQPSDKKYPFYLDGQIIDLELDIANNGPGYACDVSIMIVAVTDVEPLRWSVSVGDLSGQTRVRIPVRAAGRAADVVLEVEADWRRFDGTRDCQRFTAAFLSQRSDIDWGSLETAGPYDLEPVTTEDELIGRTDTLNQLVSLVRGSSVGSAVVFGQKRVGKTSIVKTFANRLSIQYPGQYCPIYLEGGEYVRPDPLRTVEALAEKLCRELKYADKRWNSVVVPDFEGAFAPFGDFVNELLRIAPDQKLIFILDEFDELPIDLYTHNDVADSFFLSLRSISAKPRVSFILVGSEKMKAILSLQGHELNKFKAMRVDYFDREQHWGDFVDLVRRPSLQTLEIADRAVKALYDLTAGNPYFTKLLCKSFFKAMVNRRDGHVTESEVLECSRSEMGQVAVNSFLHFWEDGIVEKGDDRRRVSVTRQKVLLSFAEVVRRSSVVTMPQLKLAARAYDLAEESVEQEVDEFVQRNVLVRDNEIVSAKVRFFGEWLRENGARELLPKLGERIATAERKKEDVAYVKDEEIRPLVDRWQMYKGRRLAVDDVRQWLKQFGSNQDQRLMFRLLLGLRFYGENQIRESLGSLHRMVARETAFRYEGKVARIRDAVISFLDGPGKSGYQYAKLYAEENRVYHEQVHEPARVAQIAKSETAAKALIFVDDFVGTGGSAVENLDRIKDGLREWAASRSSRIFLCAVSGFQEAAGFIEKEMGASGVSISVRIADPLSSRDRAFSGGGVFGDEVERERAMRLARDFGSRLEPKYPLGYGSTEALVVFERSCPNNTLPILWAARREWTPLFSRF